MAVREILGTKLSNIDLSSLYSDKEFENWHQHLWRVITRNFVNRTMFKTIVLPPMTVQNLSIINKVWFGEKSLEMQFVGKFHGSKYSLLLCNIVPFLSS